MTGHSAGGVESAELQDRMRALLEPADAANWDEAALREALARVSWSRLVEPGDAVAGSLLAHLGATTAIRLLSEGRSAQHIGKRARAAGAEVTDQAIAAGKKRWHPRLDAQEIRADLDRGIAAGLHVITPESQDWPVTLNDLGAHAPLVLWVRGTPTRLSVPQLAVVGARACTGYGAHVTAELVGAAGALGVSVVSGAAYGIDAVAHRTALAAERPTVAVLAGGADRAYPRAHTSLLERIGEAGVVCSEMVPGAAPTRWRFLQRNRVIAALARATLVTEAGLRSGSLNTAGHAAALGRQLGAVPGPMTSAASAGCHRLIREYGATLVSSQDELRELLDLPGAALADPRWLSGEGSSGVETPLQRRVIDALPLRGGRTAEAVAQHAGIGVVEARGVLAELALLGHVVRQETPGTGEPYWTLQRGQ